MCGSKYSSGCKLGIVHEAFLPLEAFSDIADTETLKGKELLVYGKILFREEQIQD